MTQSGVTEPLSASLRMSLDEAGFALLEEVFTPSEVANWIERLGEATGAPASADGNARDVLAACPDVESLWRQPPLEEVVRSTLGPAAGLVRATYFDKTSGSSWAVPWHKDLSLPVRPGVSVDPHKTVWGQVIEKDGRPSAEAPLSVLRGMLQLRINLDDQTDRNGSLAVLPGSHRDGKTVQMDGYHATPVYGRAGSVMVLRPLVAHASGHTRDESAHRRVLALEFASQPTLPDNFEWQTYQPV